MFPARTIRDAHSSAAKACRTRDDRNKRGMTLIELALTTAIITVTLSSLVMISRSLRDDTAAAETRQTLRILRGALVQYEGKHQAAPPAPTAAALEALLAEADIAPLLAKLPVDRTPAGGVVVVDGYGRPVHYLPPAQGKRAAADFVSAGPDGHLGDPFSNTPDKQRAASDNIFGSDVETPKL